jgi:hypothetical protein
MNLDLPTPQLKDFSFEKRLGSGTYASVYLAKNKVLLIKFQFITFNNINFKNIIKKVK